MTMSTRGMYATTDGSSLARAPDTSVRERLELHRHLIKSIDERRTREQDPGVGWAIEQCILRQHLDALLL